MPNIIINNELHKFFITGLSKKYNEREREGIHVTDLIYCLRKSYFRKCNKVPETLQTLFYFLDGEQRHKGFQGLVPNLKNEVEIENFDIIGTIDIGGFDNNPNGIIEIKTTRASPAKELPLHYLRQGAYYCLLKKTNKFVLLTQHINHGEIVFLDVEFTKEELKKYKEEMLRDRDLLRKAYELENVDILPLVNDNMKWQCIKCEYNGNCYKKEEIKIER